MALPLTFGVVSCSVDDPEAGPVVTFPPTSFIAPSPATEIDDEPAASATADPADIGDAADESVDADEPQAVGATTTLPPALTRDQAELAAARELWTDTGTADYELSYTVVDENGAISLERTMTVIGDEIARVVQGDEEIEDDDARTVTGWFDIIDDRLDADDDTIQVAYDRVNGAPLFVELRATDEVTARRFVQTSLRPLELSVEERQGEVGATERERLDAAIEAWSTATTDTYVGGYIATFEASCNTCPAVGRQRVTVVDGVAVDGVEDLGESPFGTTVDDWLGFLRFVIGNVDRYDVQFDAVTGVPFLIDVDARREVDGDEFRLDVLRVEPLDSVDGP